MTRMIVALYRVRGVFIYAAAATLIAIALFARLPVLEGIRPLVPVLATAAIAVAAVGIVLVVWGRGLLPERQPTVVTAPIRGRWRAMNSPATKVPSHGIRAYGQAYAIDLVHEPVDRERPAFGTGASMRSPQEYPAFGEPVLAMIDGVVVRASDWRRDHRARSGWPALLYLMTIEGAVREIGGPGFIIGNHVTIRGADGTFALVAHLQRGSVTVRAGDTVRAGEQIARCGNSGNSTEPHVHAQLMDRARPLTGQGVPLVFANVALGEELQPTHGLPADDELFTAV